jgi:Lon protease-like protein
LGIFAIANICHLFTTISSNDRSFASVIRIPREIPLMVLSNAVLFPHSLLPLHIFETRYRQMLAYCLDGERIFSVGLMRDGITEPDSLEDIWPVAGVGLIRACVGNGDGTSNLVLQGLARVKLLDLTQEQPFRIAEVELLPPNRGNVIEAEALCVKVKELCAQIQKLGVRLPANLMDQVHQIDDPEVLADVVSAAFIDEPNSRQQLLEANGIPERLRLLIQLLRGQTH